MIETSRKELLTMARRLTYLRTYVVAERTLNAMRVIAFASQKGGVGKTTLVGHLAVEAERRGAGPVALIDTDPQGSLASWWNQREVETPLFVMFDLARLDIQLAELRAHGVKIVMID